MYFGAYATNLITSKYILILKHVIKHRNYEFKITRRLEMGVDAIELVNKVMGAIVVIELDHVAQHQIVSLDLLFL